MVHFHNFFYILFFNALFWMPFPLKQLISLEQPYLSAIISYWVISSFFIYVDVRDFREHAANKIIIFAGLIAPFWVVLRFIALKKPLSVL